MKNLSLCTVVLAASLLISAIPSLAAPPNGIPNFGIVDPGLYRGAVPTNAGLADLKKMGVQTVIDLRISPKHVKAESEVVKQLGMTFVNLPMGSDPPTPKEKQTFLAIVAQAKQHPVFVHCQYGADRTGAMIGLYRRIDDHWTFDRAYAEMRHYGFKPYYIKLASTVKNANAG